MSDPKLTEYITQARQAGISDEQIRENLHKVGWKEDDIAVSLDSHSILPQRIHFRLVAILIIIGVLTVGGILVYFYSNRTKMGDLLQQNQSGNQFKKELLVDIKNRYNTSLTEFIVSYDDKHYAYITGPSTVEFSFFVPRDSLFVDGHKVETGEDIRIDRLVFSPDDKHFAYEIYATNKDRKMIIVDGENYSKFGHIVSPNGQEIVYIVSTDRGVFLAINNKKVTREYPEFSDIEFSPNGKYLAYKAIVIPGTSENLVAVLDIKENKLIHQYKSVIAYNITVSSSGKIAYSREGLDNKEHVFLDNKEIGEGYDDSELLTFSPDGNQFGFMVKENDNNWFVVLNGKKIKGPFNVEPSYGRGPEQWTNKDIFFDRDGKINYSYKTIGEEIIVNDQKFRLPIRTDVNFFKFSPDGRHFVYITADPCKNDLKWCYSLIVDGTLADQYYDEFSIINFPHFSADGKYFLFYGEGRDEIWRIVEEIK